MGCGKSSMHEILPDPNSVVLPEFGILKINRKDKLHEHSEVPVQDNNTNAAQSNVREFSKKRPAPKEKTSFELPEGNFVDGKLGVTESENVRKILETLSPGAEFVDVDFPPKIQSLYFVKCKNGDNEIVWKRPKDLVSNPKIFVGGSNRKDVVQGQLGDCWFLSSCAAIARQQKLIQRIIPGHQLLHGKDYKGAIVCRFWRFGEWVTVLIDDYLPTTNGKLIYAKSEDPNEFWIALVEKAYAKLHGSYQALEGGQSMDALVDLTGGIAERFDMEKSENIESRVDKHVLYKYISRACKFGSFVTASRKGDWRSSFKADENGLVQGHAYTISGVARVVRKGESASPLVRIRNPWSNAAEWNGKWSDGDEMWDNVSPRTRRKLLRDDKDDGEFWMHLNDFYSQFEEISICSIGPDFDNDGQVDRFDMVLGIKGQWRKGKNAGGSRNNLKYFSTNPQYLLNIKQSDQEKENPTENSENGGNHVVIGLMQEHRYSVRHEGFRMNLIGFAVYKHPVQNSSKRMSLNETESSTAISTSGTYINYREVLCRLELSTGSYVIIPATFEPETPGSFMVRVFSPGKFELKALS